MNVAILARSPFKTRALVGVMRMAFAGMTWVSRSATSRLALSVFLTPPKKRQRGWPGKLDAVARVESLKLASGEIRVWHFGDAKQKEAVVLVHGWGGLATSFGAFVQPLLDRGLRVVAFDGPAHGASPGKRTDMIAFATAIREVCHAVGPVRSVIAHSFGAACTVIANSHEPLPAKNLVLVSCFSDAIWVTETFGSVLRLNPAVLRGMRKHLEKVHKNGWKWEDLAPSRLIPLVKIPTLLVHDEQDEEVPFADASILLESAGDARLFTTNGNGHHRILRNADVHREVAQFVASGEAASAEH